MFGQFIHEKKNCTYGLSPLFFRDHDFAYINDLKLSIDTTSFTFSSDLRPVPNHFNYNISGSKAHFLDDLGKAHSIVVGKSW